MQIANYLRATVFKSSYAALDLARKNPKYSELAKNIVSAKQSNALRDLITSHSNSKKYNEFLYKINKYDFILKRLSSVENMSSKATDSNLGDAFTLKPLRMNDKAHNAGPSSNSWCDQHPHHVRPASPAVHGS